MRETLVATAIASGTSQSAAREIASVLRARLGSEKPALLLVFASLDQPLDALLPELQQSFPGTILLSASTAGEFTERGDAQHTTSAVAIAGDFIVHAGLGRNLALDAETAVATALHDQPTAVDGYPYRTAVMLIDPLAGNAEEATLIAGSLLGPDVRLAGGAAGDALKMQQTWVGLGTAHATDAVVLASIWSRKPLGVGVSHGHRPSTQGLKVTRAEGNRVYALDGKPAWQVWADELRSREPDVDSLSGEALGAFLLRYEAGLANGSEYKIRAPLTRHDDGSIGFACGIPEGSVLRITESSGDRQVESARRAAALALASVGGEKPAGAVVFDCICRKLILGDRFQTAIQSVSEELGGVPLAGFETYGEIALAAGDMSGFHNTTTVVLTLPR